MAAEKEPPPAADPEEPSSRAWMWLVVTTTLTLAGGVVVVIVYGYLARPGWIGVADKKFWDYLNLLIVPLMLAIGAFWLNAAQRAREQAAQDAQRQLEEYRENQRIQDNALDVYVNEMSKLIIDQDLVHTDPGNRLEPSQPHVVARARTLMLLPRLDGFRKGHVVRFWYQAGLLRYVEPGLGDIKDVEAVHSYIDMVPPPLDLRGGDLSGVILSRAQLEGSTLFFVHLQEADLEGANLGGANLQGVNLQGAKLRYTNLDGTNLSRADLSGATGITNEELEWQAGSLEGATMPNGQKYEDWLKSREGEGE